jgi:hypothetical protein
MNDGEESDTKKRKEKSLTHCFILIFNDTAHDTTKRHFLYIKILFNK